MTEEEFESKFNFHSIEKCCWKCKYSSGYVEWLECANDLYGEDRRYPPNIEPYCVCDLFEEKPEEAYYND